MRGGRQRKGRRAGSAVKGEEGRDQQWEGERGGEAFGLPKEVVGDFKKLKWIHFN